MNEKRIVCVALALLLLCVGLVSCTTPNEGEETADQTVWLGMNNEFPEPQSLDVGENKRVKVILLLGQSNATGCSLRSYLKQGVGEEKYAEIHDFVMNMWENKKKYRYNYIGLWVAAFNIPRKKKNCFYCSEFVAHVLSECGVVEKDFFKPIIEPIHFLGIPHRVIYEGKLQEYSVEKTAEI